MATKEELAKEAADLDVEGRSSMTKDELETAVAEAKAEGSDSTGGPAMSAKQIDNSLQEWWAQQIAAGATAEDLDAALGEFEAKGTVGMTETMADNQYGHYATEVTVIKADDEQ